MVVQFAPSGYNVDFPALLSELKARADSMQAILQIICKLRQQHQRSEPDEQQAISEVLIDHTVELEMSLGVLKLDAALFNDEELNIWTSEGADEVEVAERSEWVDTVTMKLKHVHEDLRELRIRLLNDAESK